MVGALSTLEICVYVHVYLYTVLIFFSDFLQAMQMCQYSPPQYSSMWSERNQVIITLTPVEEWRILAETVEIIFASVLSHEHP